jgi:hypothetical protein
MDLTSSILGGLIVLGALGLIFLIRCVHTHTLIVKQLRAEIDSIHLYTEDAHKYLDSQISGVHSIVDSEKKEIVDTMMEHVEVLHGRIADTASTIDKKYDPKN